MNDITEQFADAVKEEITLSDEKIMKLSENTEN